MKREYIIDKKEGNVKIRGLEQSVECDQMIENAKNMGNVVNVKRIDHDDDNPVHDGVNVQN